MYDRFVYPFYGPYGLLGNILYYIILYYIIIITLPAASMISLLNRIFFQ
jgi:hypothetical protein